MIICFAILRGQRDPDPFALFSKIFVTCLPKKILGK